MRKRGVRRTEFEEVSHKPEHTSPRITAHALVRSRLENPPPMPAPASADPLTPLLRLLNTLKYLRREIGLKDISVQALSIILLLFQAGEDGLSPGEIGAELGISQSSVSKHTKQLGTHYTSGVLTGFGLLEVLPDLRERKGKTRVRLTPSGRGICRMIEGAFQ